MMHNHALISNDVLRTVCCVTLRQQRAQRAALARNIVNVMSFNGAVIIVALGGVK